MDGFGDNFDQPEVDPAAEFLAREQDQLAGLEDELNPGNAPPAADDAMFGTQGSAPLTGSFEMIDNFGQQDGLGPDLLSSAPGVPSEVKAESEPLDEIFSTPTPPKPVVKEEPEKIRKWREEQKKRLEEKDANEEKRKEELREQAKKELEEWYKHHEEQIAKTKAANREAAKNAEKQFVAEAGEIEPGTEWERIAKLCDFNPKSSKTSKDVSRMRSIILQLKQTPPAAKRA
ncbi:clathrin light chain isoform X7 [Schistocerca americana]|uniref:clathrin light chain isoform X7 n=1 Tax=Schistocerca americana TaxID=7009 RepID=UPI001F500D28|nr:clathrin light chain isoform X7 [Schistocerca americana]